MASASLLFVLVCAWWQPLPGIVWQTSDALTWMPRLIQLAGLALALGACRVIDMGALAGLRDAPIPGSRPGSAPMFSTRAPYGWVRHPLYLAWVLMVFGMPRMTATQLLFALASLVYLLIGIPLEERTLRRTRGTAYDAYARRVPWRLLPGVYLFTVAITLVLFRVLIVVLRQPF